MSFRSRDCLKYIADIIIITLINVRGFHLSYSVYVIVCILHRLSTMRSISPVQCDMSLKKAICYQKRREECERKARRGEMDPRLEFTFQLLIDGTGLPRHAIMDHVFEGNMVRVFNINETFCYRRLCSTIFEYFLLMINRQYLYVPFFQ